MSRRQKLPVLWTPGIGNKLNPVATIYFVQGETTGLIKIGFTANVTTRLQRMQQGSPDKLALLWAYIAAITHEGELQILAPRFDSGRGLHGFPSKIKAQGPNISGQRSRMTRTKSGLRPAHTPAQLNAGVTGRAFPEPKQRPFRNWQARNDAGAAEKPEPAFGTRPQQQGGV